MQTLDSIAPPGTGWKNPGDVETYLDPDVEPWLPDGNLWSSDTGGRHAAVWTVPISADNADRRCDEAVAWLRTVSAAVPGEPIQNSGSGTPDHELLRHCHDAVDRLSPDRAGSTAFGGTPGRRDVDVDYAAYLSVESNGLDATLVAIAQAVPAS